MENIEEKALTPLVHNEENILEVNGLKKYFPIKGGFFNSVVGQVKALDGISFHIKRGTTMGLVGESGCGKTTAGRTILHLNGGKTAGQVLFNGKEVYDIPKNEYEDYIDQIMDNCGLQPFHKDRYPHEFSGGQRQRICIARALALNPEFVVCDEPVSALDVSVQAQIINLLEDLQEKYNLSYLFISHDLSVVEHISDTVGVMYLGNIVEFGTTEELFANPLHPYTKALFSAIPIPDPEAKMKRIILEGSIPSPANPPSGCKFHTRCAQCMEKCKTQVPERKDMGDGHYVCCHLYDDVK